MTIYDMTPTNPDCTLELVISITKLLTASSNRLSKEDIGIAIGIAMAIHVDAAYSSDAERADMASAITALALDTMGKPHA